MSEFSGPFWIFPDFEFCQNGHFPRVKVFSNFNVFWTNRDAATKRNTSTLTALFVTDRRYEEYLGIPYAMAPTGDYRFTKTEIPLPWSNVRDVTDWGHACIQIIAPIHELIGLAPESEDCLYINVHVPGGVDIIGCVCLSALASPSHIVSARIQF